MSGIASLADVLDAAEAAAPVDAVVAVTREFGGRLSAISVSFVIADSSGRALVRLAHVPLALVGEAASSSPKRGVRRDDDESARLIPLDGGPMERVVRTQQLAVYPPSDDTDGSGWTVIASVTERGEVTHLLA